MPPGYMAPLKCISGYNPLSKNPSYHEHCQNQSSLAKNRPGVHIADISRYTARSPSKKYVEKTIEKLDNVKTMKDREISGGRKSGCVSPCPGVAQGRLRLPFSGFQRQRLVQGPFGPMKYRLCARQHTLP